METLYGLAGLLAWNPFAAYGLLAATAVLRIRGWKGPAWLALVAVGASIGLSLGLPGCIVTPPPATTAQNPWLVTFWVVVLTAAAEFRAPHFAPNLQPLPPLRQLRALALEVAFSTGLFLAALWHPPLFGILVTLLLLYALLLIVVAVIEFLRRRAVRRLTLAAAKAGSQAAQIAAWQAGWLQPTTAATMPQLRFRRSPLAPLGLLALAILATLPWLLAPVTQLDTASAANWQSRRLTRNLLTELLVDRCDDLALRAENLRQNGPGILSDTSLNLSAEAELFVHFDVRPAQWWRLWCAVAQAEFGLDPGPSRRGFMIKAYISPVDGSTQRYGLWVPPAYDPAHPLPLLLHLHGHMMWSEFDGWQIPDAYRTADAIVVAPQARGSLDYVGIQANEVWHTLDQVTADYAIDPNRIYAAGHSMGGTGTWYLATQRPDYFAAIAPASPNLSPWAWRNQRPPDAARCTDPAIQLQRTEASIGYAYNLVRMPFLATHGAGDLIVPVENSEQMVGAIRAARVRLGLPAMDPNQTYIEYLDDATARKIIDKSASLPATDPLQIGTEYRFKNPAQRINDHAKRLDDAEQLRWLLQFRRDPKALSAQAFLDGAGLAAQAVNPPLPPPRAYGPIYRAFDEPFVLVIPDGCRRFLTVEPQTDQEFALQQIAREAVAFETTWQLHYHHAPPVVTATTYLKNPSATGSSQAPIGPRHPILLGGPDVNLATALLIEADGPFAGYAVPAGIDFHEDHLTANNATASQPAVLLAIVPPRATAPNEPDNTTPAILKPPPSTVPPPFAVVISANRGIAYFQCLRRFGVLFTSFALRQRIWFDYALADRISFDDPRLLYRCGFYTADGNIDPARAYQGDDALRVLQTGGLWPIPTPATCAPYTPITDGPRAARGPVPPTPPLHHLDLTRTLPSAVRLDAPASFGAHFLGQPLHLGGTYDPDWGDFYGAKPVLNGITMTAPGQLCWKLPPGTWHLTGRVGPDFTLKPPRTSRIPYVGFRIRVDGVEVWTTDPTPPPLPLPEFGPAPRTMLPPPGSRAANPAPVLLHSIDLILPPGSELELEMFGVAPFRGGPIAAPWELPPAIWDQLQLEMHFPPSTN